MSQKIVRAALESRLKTWADAQTPPLPVAFQNRSFTPPNPMAKHLRAFILPASTLSIDGAGDHRAFVGVFQISVVTQDGIGPGQAEQVVADLDALFPVSLLIVKNELNIVITKPASAGVAISEPGAFVVPVSFGYRADKF